MRQSSGEEYNKGDRSSKKEVCQSIEEEVKYIQKVIYDGGSL